MDIVSRQTIWQLWIQYRGVQIRVIKDYIPRHSRFLSEIKQKRRSWILDWQIILWQYMYKSRSKGQSQCHKVKSHEIKWKVWSWGIFKWNIKSYPFSLKVGHKVKVKVTRLKVMVSNKRSGHEVSICKISTPYPL